MTFTPMTVEQYRSLDHDQLEQRRDIVAAQLENPEEGVDIDNLRSEAGYIREEFDRRNAAAQLRSANIAAVASGAGNVVASSANTSVGSGVAVTRNEDPFDTDEYNRAFADYVTHGTPIANNPAMSGHIPEYMRADQFTVMSDVPNFVPTHLMNTIIEKAEGYGDLWPMLTKTNLQGGVVYNVADFNPKASWVTEDKPSEDQKLVDGDQVTFNYYMLEVKLAQSILASVTTLSAFQAKFPEVAMKAMVKALEQGYIRGNGTGQMLGILKDTRIPTENKIALTEDDISTWAGWHEKVKSKMKKSYRDGIFIMGQGTFDAYIDGMVDSSGQPIARTNYGLNGEETYRFMGKQVMTVEDDIFESFADTSASEAFAVFTKPSDYVVNTNMAMRSVRWTDEDKNIIKNKLQMIADGKILRPWGTLILTKSA